MIAPDYTGFSYGQAPGYFNAEDEARSDARCDARRRKVLVSPPHKVAFVGHSQGAHARCRRTATRILRHEGELVGVATFAPIWVSLTLFPAATTASADLTTPADINSILYAMAYAYSADELHEGTGKGVEAFQTAKQAAAKDVRRRQLLRHRQAPGARREPADFFEPTYVSSVAFNCAAYPFPTCTDPRFPTLKWKARWEADRPPIDPKGPPILATFGGKDTFITPGRAQCARDRFTKDLMVSGATTQIEYCYNDAAQHRDIIRGTDVDRLAQWVAARPARAPSRKPVLRSRRG